MKMLFSFSPRERLDALKSSDPKELILLKQQLIESSPKKKWPFGMPTSINPLILFVGASPGGSPDPYQPILDYSPSIGKPHNGLFYDDKAGFWRKIRKLGSLVINNLDSKVTEDEALSLIGALNLSESQSSSASGMSELSYAEWTFNIISKLKPRFVLMGGMKGELLKRKEIGEAFNSSLKPINWNKPEFVIPFRETNYKTSVWLRDNIKFIFLPNHVGRVPMTAEGSLKYAAQDIIKIENKY